MRILSTYWRLMLVAFLLVFCQPLATEAGIGFRFERAFDIPALSKPVTEAKFVRGTTGDEQLFLATDGDAVLLTSSATGEVIFCKKVTEAGETCGEIELADVTRDSIPDIILGLRSERRYRVLMLDGRSNYRDSQSASLRLPVSSSCAPNNYFTLSDLNGDRFAELLISADTGVSDVRLTGLTRLYSSFPKSIQWTLDRSVRRAQPMTLVDKSRILYAEPSSCENLPFAISRRYNSAAQAISIDSSGKIGPFGLIYPNPCGAVPPNFHSVIPELQLYRYDLSLKAQSDVLTEVVREFHCGDDTTTQMRRTLTSMMMHSAGTLEHIWSWDLAQPHHDYAYIPGFSDYFFAFDANGLTMFRQSDGTVITHLSQVPEGVMGWVYPLVDSLPQLMTIRDKRVELYSLDLTTDSPEDGENGLPVKFALLPPYRSGNGYVIPVDIPRIGGLKVQVLDRKGTVVNTLTSGQSPQMRRVIEWETKGVASGIYTLVATFEGQSFSRSLVLLK